MRAEKILEKFMNEKLITFPGGNNGQIVFMAGGAASGKGFAIENFIDSRSFMVRDVDEYKVALLKMARTLGVDSEIPEEVIQLTIGEKWATEKDLAGIERLSDLKLSNSKHVSLLHAYVKDRQLEEKDLVRITDDMRKENLPNILFDVTLKSIKDITTPVGGLGMGLIDVLIERGYKPENIHLIWVLTNFDMALKNNRKRERRVDIEILKGNHIGAATTVTKMISGEVQTIVPGKINGGIWVVSNNRENTIMITTESETDQIFSAKEIAEKKMGWKKIKFGAIRALLSNHRALNVIARNIDAIENLIDRKSPEDAQRIIQDRAKRFGVSAVDLNWILSAGEKVIKNSAAVSENTLADWLDTITKVWKMRNKGIEGKDDVEIKAEQISRVNIRGFLSAQVKKPGKPIMAEQEIVKEIERWIVANAPAGFVKTFKGTGLKIKSPDQSNSKMAALTKNSIDEITKNRLEKKLRRARLRK